MSIGRCSHILMQMSCSAAFVSTLFLNYLLVACNKTKRFLKYTMKLLVVACLDRDSLPHLTATTMTFITRVSRVFDNNFVTRSWIAIRFQYIFLHPCVIYSSYTPFFNDFTNEFTPMDLVMFPDSRPRIWINISSSITFLRLFCTYPLYVVNKWMNYNLEMDRLPHVAVYIHWGNPHCTTSERAIFILKKGGGC